MIFQQYVEDKVADVGIVGENIFVEKQRKMTYKTA